MRFYLATTFERKAEVRALARELSARGHELSFDWTTHVPIKPYVENLARAEQYAAEDVQGVLDADVFILLTVPEARIGMHVELGVALGSLQQTGRPKVYVVGEDTSRSLFYFSPGVERRQTLKEVLQELNE